MKNEVNYVDLTNKNKNPLGLMELTPSNISSSIKSTQSNSKYEMITVSNRLETSIAYFIPEDQSLDEKFPLKRQETQMKYKDIFMTEKNSKKLEKQFLLEKCLLRKSDTKNKDFNIKSVLLRLKNGYSLYKYNYHIMTRKEIFLIVENSVLQLKTSSKKIYKSIPFDSIYGVVVGCETFKFKKYKPKIDKFNGYIHNNYNCFSIITDTNSIDFGSISDLAKYDICIGVSWLSFHYNKLSTCLPYSKCNSYKDTLTTTMVMLKLQESAKERYMSIVEIFLVFFIQLAICKTLKESNRSYKKIRMMLNKRYDYEGKISRFMLQSLVSNIQGLQSKAHLKNSVRVSLLCNTPLNSSSKSLNLYSPSNKKFRAPVCKPVVYVPFFVPDSTREFEKQNHIDFEVNRSKRVSKTSTIKAMESFYED